MLQAVLEEGAEAGDAPLGCRNGWKESGRFLWLEMGKQQHGASGGLFSFPWHSLVLPLLCPVPQDLQR